MGQIDNKIFRLKKRIEAITKEVERHNAKIDELLELNKKARRNNKEAREKLTAYVKSCLTLPTVEYNK
ncbi:MAG: hypothetical protein ABIQ31_26795 [Ferruginibacter sp.]